VMMCDRLTEFGIIGIGIASNRIQMSCDRGEGRFRRA
jgi:hypothetical protein